MYTITDDQENEIENFISKLPDSLVKSQIINWFEEIRPTNRLTSEQLEKFLSFQNALPKEVQSYPQTVAQWFKNESSTVKAEANAETPKESQVDFKSLVADVHADYKPEENTENYGEQKQEILHTLNVEDKALAGTKAEPKAVEDKPTYEEKLKADAKESAKTSGGKPDALKKEEESIIARNKDVSDKPAPKKDKVIVVAQKKSVAKSVPKAAPKKAAAPKKSTGTKTSKKK